MDELVTKVPSPLWLVTDRKPWHGFLGRVYVDREEALRSRATHEVVVELRLADSATGSLDE